MKKRIFAIVVAVVMLCALMVPTFAATKSDVLAEMEKSPVYKYIKTSVENAARTIEVTEEQADQLIAIVQAFIETVPEDKGPAAKAYTDAEIEAVITSIDKVCAVLNLTYKFVPNPNDASDSILNVYDEEGKLIFEYNGNAVADTAAASTSAPVYFTIGAVLLAAAAVALVASKKRVTE